MGKIGDDVGIHIRAIRFGYENPNGFLYQEIEHHYKNRKKEWGIVKKFLNDSYDNFTKGLNRETPYILLEQLGNNNPDNCKYTLSYQAYILYVQYLDIQQNKKNTKLAQETSEKALLYTRRTLFVAIFALVMSIIFSFWQIKLPTKIDERQINKIIHALK